jgi:hypothetical protein
LPVKTSWLGASSGVMEPMSKLLWQMKRVSQARDWQPVARGPLSAEDVMLLNLPLPEGLKAGGDSVSRAVKCRVVVITLASGFELRVSANA